MRDLIPGPLFDSLQQYLVNHGNHAESGWEAGSAEEDTITGHLGAELQRDWSRSVRFDGERWRWRVRYKKFRGRGPGAFEAIAGADGIIQVEVTRSEASVSYYKGVLFQAKKNDIRHDRRLIEQVQKMEDLANGCSAVFEYRSDGYRAVAGRPFLEELGTRAVFGRERLQPLGSFLGTVFLPCDAGTRGLYYDGVRRLLLLPTEQGEVRAIRVEVGHRIAIEVESRALI